jgi:hypothetical protein
LVVRSETVSSRVGIAKHAGVKHKVRGRPNTRHHSRRRKGSLFHILEIVGGVLVEDDLADLAQRVFLMRPGEGIVENVDAGVLCFLGVHDLEVYGVGGVVSAFDRVVKVFDVVVGSFTSETECLICVKVFDSSFGSDVPLDIYKGAVLLAKLVCVNTESVDVAELRYIVSNM